jgi:hypothetical protein
MEQGSIPFRYAFQYSIFIMNYHIFSSSLSLLFAFFYYIFYGAERAAMSRLNGFFLVVNLYAQAVHAQSPGFLAWVFPPRKNLWYGAEDIWMCPLPAVNWGKHCKAENCINLARVRISAVSDKVRKKSHTHIVHF